MQGEEQYEQSLQSMSEEGEYRLEEIKFPAAASQLCTLYEVYIRNAEKIAWLNRQLLSYQKEIADLQQLADQKQVSVVIELSEESGEQDVDQRLRVFNQLRRKRREQEQRLQCVYRKLKLLATQENMLSNREMSGLLHQWLGSHKKVVGVRVEGEELVVLSRESKRSRFQRSRNEGNHKRNRSKGQSLGLFERSCSSGSDDTSKSKKEQCWYYSIRVMSIQGLIRRVQESGGRRRVEMEARRNQEEIYSMLIRLIRVRLKKKGLGSSGMNKRVQEELERNRREIAQMVFKLVGINEEKQKKVMAVCWQEDCVELKEANKRQAAIQLRLVELMKRSDEMKKLLLQSQQSQALRQQLNRIECQIEQNLYLLISINEEKKQYLPLEDLEESGESLQRKRARAEGEVDLVRLVNLNYRSRGVLLLCAYSKQLGLYFLFQKPARVLVVGMEQAGTSSAKVLESIQLDVKDEVILLQCRGRKLLVGTKEGVFRVYEIGENNRLQLVQIYRCYHPSVKSIETYYLPAEFTNSNIYFISEQRDVFELNCMSYLVTRVGEVAERAVTVFGNYLITDNCIETVVFKNPLQRTKNQKLTNWYSAYRLSNCFKPIVYIQGDQKGYRVLTVDKKGNVSVIFI